MDARQLRGALAEALQHGRQVVQAAQLARPHADAVAGPREFHGVDVELLQEGADRAHVADIAAADQRRADVLAGIGAVVAHGQPARHPLPTAKRGGSSISMPSSSAAMGRSFSGA